MLVVTMKRSFKHEVKREFGVSAVNSLRRSCVSDA